ncbi:MAG TPA: hypothetical protein VF593_10710 [Chthoniobacteraceae bacterium]|jgi:hypothetical protein
MRTLFVLIVIGLLGYLGWTRRTELLGSIQHASSRITSPQPSPDGEQSRTEENERPATPLPTPAPRRVAAPGVYWVTQRVSVQLETGVKALNVGKK